MLLELSVGMIAGLIVFLITVLAYVLGVSHGRAIRKDSKVSINPVSAYKQKKEEELKKKDVDKFTQGLNNILNFGEPFNRKVNDGN